MDFRTPSLVLTVSALLSGPIAGDSLKIVTPPPPSSRTSAIMTPGGLRFEATITTPLAKSEEALPRYQVVAAPGQSISWESDVKSVDPERLPAILRFETAFQGKVNRTLCFDLKGGAPYKHVTGQSPHDLKLVVDWNMKKLGSACWTGSETKVAPPIPSPVPATPTPKKASSSIALPS